MSPRQRTSPPPRRRSSSIRSTPWTAALLFAFVALAYVPSLQNGFTYDPKFTLKDYVKKVFSAANEYSGNHPYTAIKWLGVSQGYFYKILKELKTA